MDNQSAPFARGQTFYQGGTIDTANYAGVELEGRQVVFKDRNVTSGIGAQKLRSGRDVRCICVRNTSAAALLPKRLVTYASGYYKQRVDGYVTTDYQAVAGVVDDLLPAAGVPVGDLFWLVVEGPCLAKAPLAGAGFGSVSIAQGDELFGLTAATSGATTSGRFTGWNGTFTAAQTTDGTAGKIALRSFARAMSAATSGQTNADILIDVRAL